MKLCSEVYPVIHNEIPIVHFEGKCYSTHIVRREVTDRTIKVGRLTFGISIGVEGYLSFKGGGGGGGGSFLLFCET